jgi:hypothetical protein
LHRVIGRSQRHLYGVIEAVLICMASGIVALILCVWVRRSALAVVPEIIRGLAVPVVDVRIGVHGHCDRSCDCRRLVDAPMTRSTDAPTTR